MSLEIIRAGILDTIQDTGRYGYQHLGINPSGAMDRHAAQAANALLGKDLSAPVIEMHFPAAGILFHRETIICITGADLCPSVNKKNIPVAQPVLIPKNSVLNFQKKITGARCYVAVLHDLDLPLWLNSHSTNLVAKAGGYNGRALKKGDKLHFKNDELHLAIKKEPFNLPWRSSENISLKKEIRFIKGNEWETLKEEGAKIFTSGKFRISSSSNRMGYRLQGTRLTVNNEAQLVSSGVTFGTIQLLPNGQLIILMADHQTTGGYPRIAQVISADLPLLAQSNPGDEIFFTEVNVKTAEEAFIDQHSELLQMQSASAFNIQKFLRNGGS
jgi:antagonist of KipI